MNCFRLFCLRLSLLVLPPCLHSCKFSDAITTYGSKYAQEDHSFELVQVAFLLTASAIFYRARIRLDSAAKSQRFIFSAMSLSFLSIACRELEIDSWLSFTDYARAIELAIRVMFAMAWIHLIVREFSSIKNMIAKPMHALVQFKGWQWIALGCGFYIIAATKESSFWDLSKSLRIFIEELLECLACLCFVLSAFRTQHSLKINQPPPDSSKKLSAIE